MDKSSAMHVHGGLGVTPQLTRSLESELESASKSGELKLQCKNLREFPNHGNKYDLRDTVMAGEEMF